MEIPTFVKHAIIGFATFASLVMPAKSPGVVDDNALAACDAASTRAARLANVPISILNAIARTESGTTRNGAFGPWPWTVNVEGKGVYFGSKKNAELYIATSIRRGYTNIDVGCFQINYKWHGQHFSSLTEMLDPHQNALYAATFLSRLYREFGNWEHAVGAFHSRNELHSEAYLRRFRPILSSLEKMSKNSGLKEKTERKPNSYPLLLAGKGSHTPGSLFSADSSSRRRFIENTFLQDTQ